MRLNQLAKKVGKPYTRVEKYIRKDLNIEGIEGPNSRVNEDIVDKVISKFGLFKQDVKNEPKIKLQTVEAKPAEISPDDRGLEEINLDFAIPAESVIPNLDGLGEEKDMDIENEELDQVDSNEKVEKAPLLTNESLPQVKETAESSERRISETVETEETVLHIDQEGTIVAPKVELEGLKVRGKIDIPGVTDQVQVEDTPEKIELTDEETNQLKQEEAKKIKAVADAAEAKRKKIDSDAAKALAFKEKKAKEEKEVLKLQIEKEKEKKKEVGKKHYLDNVQHAPKVNKSKKKKAVVLEQEVEKKKSFETKEKYASTDNMTAWQKLVRWFNT
jgi:hypothetical protein